MSFLESLGLDVIKSEKDALRAMRAAAEQWYNDLTQPFLPVLTGAFDNTRLSHDQRLRLAKLANDMLCAELLINNGEALENKLAEIEKSSGIPLFSGRKDLRERATEYLNSGVFLKQFAYGSFKKSSTSEGCREAIVEAREKWRHFEAAKNSLVKQINSQLAKIG